MEKNMVEFSLDAIDAAGGAEAFNKETQENGLTINIQNEESAPLPEGFRPTEMSFAAMSPEDKIRDLRAKLRSSNKDPLEVKQEEMSRGLEEIGLSRKDLGKTGNSLTGEVTERHKEVANSQTEDAKDIMRWQRRMAKVR